jgi:tetratricopeptide (TPR) repeat protein
MEAQRFYNQGLTLAYGFNHAEAARSFFEAIRQDSTSAMCWWGYAYVLGPNYNAGMVSGNFQRAYAAVQKAKKYSNACTQMEKDLVEALSNRYSSDTTIVRAVLDSAYAAAMRSVYSKYKDDANIGALFAEALMDLHPWDLWKKDGAPQPWTPEIIAVLGKSLQENPRHVGANHFYIHAMEASQHPENSLASANLLRNLVPGSGHLVHMPAHTYIRIGRYHDGVVTNLKAILADSLYTEACYAQGMYPSAYYPHNYHFVAACATLAGESKTALKAAEEIVSHTNKKLLMDKAWAPFQNFYSIKWYVAVKLGLWKQILNSKTDKELKYPTAIWHYAQGMANLSQGNVDIAKKNLSEMKALMGDSALKAMPTWRECLIAGKTLEGEINAREKNYAKAISLLKEAVSQEELLKYAEPPEWPFSVRQNLGAVLLEAQKYQEAVRIYEEDLNVYPENGWSLRGLMTAYQKLGQKNKYEKTKQRFENAWQHADLAISSSRIL